MRKMHRLILRQNWSTWMWEVAHTLFVVKGHQLRSLLLCRPMQIIFVNYLKYLQINYKSLSSRSNFALSANAVSNSARKRRSCANVAALVTTDPKWRHRKLKLVKLTWEVLRRIRDRKRPFINLMPTHRLRLKKLPMQVQTWISPNKTNRSRRATESLSFSEY